MASSKEYLTFVLEQLSGLEGVTYRAMMGEYILYFRDKIVGGIYDDRLLVKPVPSAIALMPMSAYELPYERAKEMLLVDDVDNKEFLCNLFLSMYDEPGQPGRKTYIIFPFIPACSQYLIWFLPYSFRYLMPHVLCSSALNL